MLPVGEVKEEIILLLYGQKADFPATKRWERKVDYWKQNDFFAGKLCSLTLCPIIELLPWDPSIRML